MSSLNSLYIKLDTLKTLVSTLEKKGESGINLTVSLSDESNQYNQNVSAYVSQSKEEREAKKDRFYVGNGSTFWSKGETPTFIKGSINNYESQQSDNKTDDMPF